PLAAVALISIEKTTAALRAATNEQLVTRSTEIARSIDQVFSEEKKIALNLSIDPDIVAAARAVTDTHWAAVPAGATAPAAAAAPAPTPAPATGKAAPGPTAGKTAAKAAPAPDPNAVTSALVSRVTTRLESFMKTKGLGDSYIGIVVTDSDGNTWAASDPIFMGVNAKDRQYWKDAIAGTLNIGAPSLNKVTQKPQTPVAAPIRAGDKVVGVVAMLVDIGFLNDLISGEKIGKTGYAFVVDNTGLDIAHPNADNVFKTNITTVAGMEQASKKMLAGGSGVVEYTFQGVVKTQGYATVPSTGWVVSLTLPQSEYLAPAVQAQNMVLLFGIIAIAVALVVYFLFSRSITRPLAQGVAFAQTVASGDFTKRLDYNQKDEVGELAQALNGMCLKLKDMVATIQDSAEQVASSSEQISASAQKLSDGSQSQASTLEETSASVEELTASVEQVAEHSQSQTTAVEQGSASMTQVQKAIDEVSGNLVQISALANRSVENAVEGAKAVQQVVSGINLISQSSEKIGGIITVISDIADQTNLLALNASIEAARAGEHGRGFAVVADEVSKLADRSASSTKEIEALIKESVKNVTEGVKTALGSQQAMEQIRDASQKVKGMIVSLSDSMNQQVAAIRQLSAALENVSEMSASISAATEEQTTNAKQVSKAVENVNELTQSAASASEEMSAATQQLSGMAQELQRLMAQFKIVDGALGSSSPRRATVASQKRPALPSSGSPAAGAAERSVDAEALLVGSDSKR
ncbi:MAG TPA: methyl-accepting chemotaxis protein, partial [Spirochaetia bacterium]|nr:methyl-accepting chemotaxis protein [Spirochaetia bacterium]